MNKIKEAFNTVKADDKLKNSTIAFIASAKQPKQNHRVYTRYAAAFAVVLALVFGIGRYSVINSAVSYISIDVNPSIELALNRFDTVVEASAYNDSGSEVLASLDLKGKSYTDAIDTLLTNQEFTSYIQDDAQIDFTVVSDNEERIIEGIQGCESYGQYNSSCHKTDKATAQSARVSGLSLGKYNAYMELSEHDSSVTIEDCKNMSIHQIRDMIDQCEGDENSTEHDNAEEHGEHHTHSDCD